MWLAAHVAAFLAIKNPHDLSIVKRLVGCVGCATLLWRVSVSTLGRSDSPHLQAAVRGVLDAA